MKKNFYDSSAKVYVLHRVLSRRHSITGEIYTMDWKVLIDAELSTVGFLSTSTKIVGRSRN
jgi:hypothetical protein